MTSAWRPDSDTCVWQTVKFWEHGLTEGTQEGGIDGMYQDVTYK